jgi:hypothetical protein
MIDDIFDGAAHFFCIMLIFFILLFTSSDIFTFALFLEHYTLLKWQTKFQVLFRSSFSILSLLQIWQKGGNYQFYRVPTLPGKREKSVNSVYTFHGLEKSLNFTEIAKIRGKIRNFIAGQGSFLVPNLFGY